VNYVQKLVALVLVIEVLVAIHHQELIMFQNVLTMTGKAE
jgi:hypothetical protein